MEGWTDGLVGVGNDVGFGVVGSYDGVGLGSEVTGVFDGVDVVGSEVEGRWEGAEVTGADVTGLRDGMEVAGEEVTG